MMTERLTRSTKNSTALRVTVALLAALPARAALPAPATATQTSTVPTALTRVAEYSENIYDLAQANDWTNAAARLHAVEASSRRLSSEIPSGKGDIARLQTTIRAVHRDIAAKDRLGAMRDANRATGIAADLSASFHPAMPVQVPRLDYDGRELEVWAAAGNAAKLKAAASDIEQNWDILRSQVVAHGGGAEATKFDGLVARVRAAKSPQQYRVVARPILDEVDKLEKVFGP